MPIPRQRQPEGIPAGGQFAPEAHAEPEVALPVPRPLSTPPAIYATVVLQRWVDDGAEYVDQVAFDARRVLAAMKPEHRAALTDGSEYADEVFNAAVRRGLVAHHEGPFEVYVRDAMDEALQKDPEVFEKIAAMPDNRPAAAVLDAPLSAYEIGARADEDGWVEGLATFDMDDLIDRDLDGHGDQIGEKLVGSELLMDVSAKPVSVTPDGSIVCKLTGDASAIIEGFDENEAADYEAGRAEAGQDS
jgi:hypothetical protein